MNDDERAMEELMTQLKGCAEGEAFDEKDPIFDLTVEAIFNAWVAQLITDPAGGTARIDRLDDAMLPEGTTDDILMSYSGGLADGQYIRSTLRKLKAALPPGKALPDTMLAILKAAGIKVV